jgi:hypothetical protein
MSCNRDAHQVNTVGEQQAYRVSAVTICVTVYTHPSFFITIAMSPLFYFIGMAPLPCLKPLNFSCEGVANMLKNMARALNSQLLCTYIYIYLCVF